MTRIANRKSQSLPLMMLSIPRHGRRTLFVLFILSCSPILSCAVLLHGRVFLRERCLVENSSPVLVVMVVPVVMMVLVLMMVECSKRDL